MIPTQTTTYHLTAMGAGGTMQATALVTVTQPPPVPIRKSLAGEILLRPGMRTGAEFDTRLFYPS